MVDEACDRGSFIRRKPTCTLSRIPLGTPPQGPAKPVAAAVAAVSGLIAPR